MRISRPCYDKRHRCPGWAGGGFRYAKRDRCNGGSLDGAADGSIFESFKGGVSDADEWGTS